MGSPCAAQGQGCDFRSVSPWDFSLDGEGLPGLPGSEGWQRWRVLGPPAVLAPEGSVACRQTLATVPLPLLSFTGSADASGRGIQRLSRSSLSPFPLPPPPPPPLRNNNNNNSNNQLYEQNTPSSSSEGRLLRLPTPRAGGQSAAEEGRAGAQSRSIGPPRRAGEVLWETAGAADPVVGHRPPDEATWRQSQTRPHFCSGGSSSLGAYRWAEPRPHPKHRLLPECDQAMAAGVVRIQGILGTGTARRRKAEALRAVNKAQRLITNMKAQEEREQQEVLAREAAAIKIQAIARGRLERKTVLQKLEDESQAALKIQAIIRGNKARRKLEAELVDLPQTDIENLWEHLNPSGKATHLPVIEALELFWKSRYHGLSPEIAQLVPQFLNLKEEGEEETERAVAVNLEQAVKLCAILLGKAGQEGMNDSERLESVRLTILLAEADNIEDLPAVCEYFEIGLDDILGLKKFKRMIKDFSLLMHLDQDWIITTMAWADSGFFELTPMMSEMLAEHALRHLPKRYARQRWKLVAEEFADLIAPVAAKASHQQPDQVSLERFVVATENIRQGLVASFSQHLRALPRILIERNNDKNKNKSNNNSSNNNNMVKLRPAEGEDILRQVPKSLWLTGVQTRGQLGLMIELAYLDLLKDNFVSPLELCLAVLRHWA
ncbi:unnamed protein product [Polarella glacialis]|uniref:Uncharacterized protein n=1 Tax=Polarella glacialis TaxID=89957 RepID=A0A813J4X5_POLGL|nr:unnamed protein product [Polarella glacialis]